ncbi:hypothetical protein [Streptosporangium sp. NPDC006007]|uniref:hypothetical protein n=1 Tax=Streptosporangium sp. NPDC006007 TaxID=3154575 RepID=UPI0033A8BFBB
MRGLSQVFPTVTPVQARIAAVLIAAVPVAMECVNVWVTSRLPQPSYTPPPAVAALIVPWVIGNPAWRPALFTIPLIPAAITVSALRHRLCGLDTPITRTPVGDGRRARTSERPGGRRRGEAAVDTRAGRRTRRHPRDHVAARRGHAGRGGTAGELECRDLTTDDFLQHANDGGYRRMTLDQVALRLRLQC